MYRAEVRIELKPGVADPEGANTKKALELLGFTGLGQVKTVHAYSIEVDAKGVNEAKKQIEEMCKRLLVNPVVHTPRITFDAGNGSKAGQRDNGATGAKKAAKPATKVAKAAKKAPAKAAKPAKKTAKKAAKRSR